MQSKRPQSYARREQGLRERNAVCHLYGLVTWLQHHVQFMLDDLVG
jgi:hypothetical protein